MLQVAVKETESPSTKELVFAKEPLSPLWLEVAKGLLNEHYQEVGPVKHGIPLDPDMVLYKELEDKGMIETHTARDRVSGELVGYSVWIITTHPHYKGSVTAFNDVVFMRKDYRKGRQGYMFLKYTIEKIKALGKVQRMLFHVKPHVDFGPTLERLGASMLETVYAITL